MDPLAIVSELAVIPAGLPGRPVADEVREQMNDVAGRVPGSFDEAVVVGTRVVIRPLNLEEKARLDLVKDEIYYLGAEMPAFIDWLKANWCMGCGRNIHEEGRCSCSKQEESE